MPRYNVEYKGKWACYTSISDGFITEFMDKDKYEKWRKIEYGLANYEPAEKCNMMEMSEAVFSASLNRSRDEWIETLKESGLPDSEIEKLVYDCETEYYVPTLNGVNYECPNCGHFVDKNGESCPKEDCGTRLVWRK